jgi:hypothetical protein
MSLKTQLKYDAMNCILNTDEFAEDITYCPHGGTNKSIKALVERQRITPAGEDGGRTLVNNLEITIANDSTYGVTSINKGFDKVIIAKSVGGDNVTCVVADVLGQDEGMWHLLVRE